MIQTKPIMHWSVPKIKRLILALLPLVTGMGLIAGGRPLPPGNIGDNIAQAKTYSFSVEPNYTGGCTDPDDLVQLTDGFFAAGTPIWTKTPTVGWQSSSNPIITIDLEQVYPIQGIELSTAGGISGVQWPNAINIYVSNDGIHYYDVGNLVTISNTENGDAPSYGTYATHRYRTNTLTTRGRYVRLEVIQSPYTFIDDIKIYRGNDSLLGTNIALGCPYTRTEPNYSGCLDPTSSQLVDGVYADNPYTFIWNQTATVGWHGPFATPWIEVTVDLGAKNPIEGVTLNTAAGAANVEWPLAVTVLVSDDDINYFKAGELISLSSEHGLPSPSGYQRHCYWTDRLATCGRYVKFLVATHGYYSFIDEIEIYLGNSGMLAYPSRGTAQTFNQTLAANLVKEDIIRAGQSRRIVLDADAVKSATDAATGISDSTKAQITDQLKTVINEAMYLPDVTITEFRAVLPLNNTHRLVFTALKSLWQAQGLTGLIGWTPDSPWDTMDITQTPGYLDELTVYMLQDEYRSTAVNLTNAWDTDLNVDINISGLPGGVNPDYITVHKTVWTDTKNGIPIVSALEEILPDNGFTINIPAGTTCQIWLTFHPVTTNPGLYSGYIVADGGVAGTVSVPLTFRLSSLAISKPLSLSLGGFDYTHLWETSYSWITQDKSVFINNLIEYLLEFGVDTTWSICSMPSNVDFSILDNWINLWPVMRNYRVFTNAGTTFNGTIAGTTAFNQAVADWINAYAAYWTSQGLNLEQLGLHLVDEPKTLEQANTIMYWANAIKAAQPAITVWTNPCFGDPSDGLAMFGTVDTLCPNRPSFLTAGDEYQNVFRQQQANGKELEFYSCLGHSGKYDPYSYYRLQAWTCWQENASGMLFWTFGDSGGSAWNEYQSFTNYTPFYIDTNGTITSAKAMEAIRESVQDYEYLMMLKTRIAELESSGSGVLLDEARSLRDNAADFVLNATGADQLIWTAVKDRSLADQKRIEIIDMLELLDLQFEENIARQKNYTLSPTPNYWGGCTDPDDLVQLTDENYVTGIPMWLQAAAVGWYAANPATITIDLGAVKSIQGASYNTAAGSGGVTWPSAVDVSVSNDGSSFTPVGNLVTISNNEHGDAPPSGSYLVHRYRTKQFNNVYGRFVRLEITGSPYVFTDEIEIY